MKKDLKYALISTGLLVFLSLLTLAFSNRPQCPAGYTQAQIDAARCIVGANIGLGFMLAFVLFPILVFVVLIWYFTLKRLLSKPDKKDMKE